MIIQLKGVHAERYKAWLNYFERLLGHYPTYVERTESFFRSRDEWPPA